jgi:hypothetical protein
MQKAHLSLVGRCAVTYRLVLLNLSVYGFRVSLLPTPSIGAKKLFITQCHHLSTFSGAGQGGRVFLWISGISLTGAKVATNRSRWRDTFALCLMVQLHILQKQVLYELWQRFSWSKMPPTWRR